MGVCCPVGHLHSLSSIPVYSLKIDRQHLIHMNRQVTLNITCGTEEMKQHASAHTHTHTHCSHAHTHTHKFAPAFEDTFTNSN